MATRKQAREAIIQILYAKELGNDQAITQAAHFLDSQKIRNKQQSFALNLLHGVCEQESHITQVMNVFLKTWDIERLGVIEKNILKLGIYELLQTNTQKAIVINEAIELTKSFSVQDAFRLVNGVLDSVAKTDSATLENLLKEQAKNAQESQAQESLATQEILVIKKDSQPRQDSQKSRKAAPKMLNLESRGRTREHERKRGNDIGGDKRAREPQSEFYESTPKKTNPAHIKAIRIAKPKGAQDSHQERAQAANLNQSNANENASNALQGGSAKDSKQGDSHHSFTQKAQKTPRDESRRDIKRDLGRDSKQDSKRDGKQDKKQDRKQSRQKGFKDSHNAQQAKSRHSENRQDSYTQDLRKYDSQRAVSRGFKTSDSHAFDSQDSKSLNQTKVFNQAGALRSAKNLNQAKDSKHMENSKQTKPSKQGKNFGQTKNFKSAKSLEQSKSTKKPQDSAHSSKRDFKQDLKRDEKRESRQKAKPDSKHLAHPKPQDNSTKKD